MHHVIPNTVAMKSEKSHLYLTAALIWGVPGGIITTKGVVAYAQLHAREWWLFAITLIVLAAFYLMFRRVVTKYSAHIEGLTAPYPIWKTFPLTGWLLMLFMMSLGMSLRHIQGIPTEFFASFYSGLGPMLLLSAVRFLRRINANRSKH